MIRPAEIVDFLKAVIREFTGDKASLLAAAIAYYATFSIGPILLITIAVAGLAFGREAVEGRITDEISGLVGRDGAEAVQNIIAGAHSPSDSIIATIIGVVTLIIGAAGLFKHLQEALNIVWGVEPPEHEGGVIRSLIETIRDRFLSFTMVLGIGFLLLIGLVISAGIAALDEIASGYVPWQFVAQVLNQIVSVAIFTALFAMMFKILPDAIIKWRDVLWGALFTAVLFTIGKFILGVYLGNGSFTTSYGAAGSFVLLLAWIYYSTQILMFGAEFTQVYARRYGSDILDIGAQSLMEKAVDAVGEGPDPEKVPTRKDGKKAVPAYRQEGTITEPIVEYIPTYAIDSGRKGLRAVLLSAATTIGGLIGGWLLFFKTDK